MLKNFPIRKKILMGLIPMIILLVVYSLFSFFQLSNANGKLKVLGGYIHQQAQYGTSLFLLNNIARREQLNQQYLATESQQTAEIIALLEKDFSLLLDELIKNSENNEYVDKVIAKEKQYLDLVHNQLWRDKAQLSALLKQYNDDVSPQLELMLNDINAKSVTANEMNLVALTNQLTIAVLRTRADFNEYISTKDSAYFERAKQEIAQARAVLNKIEQQNADKETVTDLADSISNIENLIGDGFSLITQLQNNRLAVESLSNEIISDMVGAQIHQWRFLDFQTKQISQFMDTYQWQSILVLTITIITGVAILLWIAKTIVSSIQMLVERVSEISEGEGDLTKRIDIHAKDETGALASLLNRFISSIHDIIQNAQQTASEVIDRSTQNLAHATESSQLLKEQQDKNEFIATAIDQLSQSSSEIAESTVNSNSEVENTFQALSKGTSVVERSVEASRDMREQMRIASSVSEALAKETEEIVNFLIVIKSMTDQTNLLALNAAIEAARAGDAGRGFAVVADEVRTLANKTQQSASEIEHSIENLQAESKAVVEAINQCRSCAEDGAEATQDTQQIFAQVHTAIEKMQAMSISIASASEQQSLVTTQIKEDIDNVFKFSDSISRSAQASQQASKWSSQTASELNQVLTRFVV